MKTILKALLPFSKEELMIVENIIEEIDYPLEELVTHCHEKMQSGENFLDWNLIEELFNCIKWKFDEYIIEYCYDDNMDHSPITTENLGVKTEDRVTVYEIINETAKYKADEIKKDIFKELNSIPEEKQNKIYKWFYDKLSKDLE